MMQTEPEVVFYVDDNPRARRLLTSILKQCGLEVITANDPLEALAVCERITFDVALLDYEMPKMRGPELAQEIKFLVPDIPIVLISGKVSLSRDDLASVDAHFGAGSDLDELVDRLRMLAQAKSAPERADQSITHWNEST